MTHFDLERENSSYLGGGEEQQQLAAVGPQGGAESAPAPGRDPEDGGLALEFTNVFLGTYPQAQWDTVVGTECQHEQMH